MAKALEHSQVRGDRQVHKPVVWTKRMSDHTAGAVLIYTVMHIVVTMQAIKGESGSILPYFGLILLVGAIIPGCIMLERRWEKLAASGEPDERLRSLFVRDVLYLWTAALGLPFLITGLITALGSLA